MRILPLLFLLAASALAAPAELRVPAFTAYLEPDANAATISEKAGLSGWKGGATKVEWFGKMEAPGQLTCALELTKPEGAKLRLTVEGATHPGVPAGPGSVSFGAFGIARPGYVRLTLEADGAVEGEIHTFVLSGPASERAHFNLLPRRNAASVHLNYPLPKETPLDAFYSEATAVEDPVHTFYMACGFHRGYFGMQINGPAERRIIFSVWDSGAGAGAKTRETVAAGDQTALLAKGEGVVASVFGNEGTGGHSHLVYPWKTGETQRFLLTSQPAENGSAIFSGYWFHPEKKAWQLIARFRAPKAEAALGHFHSFSEDFVGGNGQLRRKALFGRQWVHARDGRWLEITAASFSHDETGKAARLDREMGVEKGCFFLAHGGYTGGTTAFGEKFSRPATGAPPDVDLARLPQ